MKKLFSDYFVIALLIIITILIHWKWFFDFSILTYSDWYYLQPEVLKEYIALPSLWNTSVFGGVDLLISFYPFNFVMGILSYLHMGFAVIERIVFMWPLVLISSIGSYLLIRKNTSSKIGAFVGSLVYTYNTYFLVGQTSHLTLMTSYSFAPIVILAFQITLEKRKILPALLCGILAFIASFYEFRIFFITLWVLFLYFLFYMITSKRERTWKNFMKDSLFAFIPVGIMGLLNSYWILGFVFLGSLKTNELFSRTLFGNEFLNINYAFTLFHPFWTGGRPTEFIQMPIFLYFWIIPFCAFIGLLLQRKNKNILFFGFVALLGIFLTKQVGQPFVGVYPWLYNHFPGFNAYREASKFFLLIALGYSVVIGAFVAWMWKYWTKQKWQIYGKYLLTLVLAGIFLWNTKPIITGKMATLFVPRHIPQDYNIAKEFIKNDPTFYRTYWFPIYSRWSLNDITHPAVSAVTQTDGQWNSFIEKERNIIDKYGIVEKYRYNEADLTLLLLQKPYANNLLSISSIKYVFLPIQDQANEDDFFRFYGRPRDYYEKKLDDISYLKRININTHEIVAYENPNVKPHIYLTSEKETIQKQIPFTSVQYKMISPTEYTIDLHNLKGPHYLNFSASYHPSWKLYVGTIKGIDAITKKHNFLPDSFHSMNDAYLNSYYIDPNVICKEFTCKKNNTGGYDLTLTLYFVPQAYSNIGIVISLLTLCLTLGGVLFLFIKERFYERKN